MPIFSYLCSWVKPRQRRGDEPSNSFPFGKKKRTKSGLSTTDDEDHQRSTIIRKSLQSRTSSRVAVRPEDNNYETEEDDSSTSLRTDWKAYEADIQRNKSMIFIISTSTTIFWVQLHQSVLPNFTNNLKFNSEPNLTQALKGFPIVPKPKPEHDE
ncbi:hypothetical protein FLONG3_2189 [Fusarium longipes]|uniref:Uncharacterized protein n=1 Tax=Fusarium longipes TaxID=694270 RepID=A0A395T6B5_9HYPO|nr:hypothetical protein FLONG3_2189 [Fusarium longipes]